MSKIEKADIEHVAQLARLKLNETEEQKFTQEIGEILNYVDELGQIQEKDVEPISQISGLKNVARPDEITNANDRDNLLSNTPEKNDGYIKVKQVFKN